MGAGPLGRLGRLADSSGGVGIPGGLGGSVVGHGLDWRGERRKPRECAGLVGAGFIGAAG